MDYFTKSNEYCCDNCSIQLTPLSYFHKQNYTHLGYRFKFCNICINGNIDIKQMIKKCKKKTNKKT